MLLFIHEFRILDRIQNLKNTTSEFNYSLSCPAGFLMSSRYGKPKFVYKGHEYNLRPNANFGATKVWHCVKWCHTVMIRSTEYFYLKLNVHRLKDISF